jgi:hypothetical protein
MAQKSPYQTLKGLKERAFETWYMLNGWLEEVYSGKADIAALFVQFKNEVRSQFGDLRYKATWERAWAKIEMDALWAGFDNNEFLVQFLAGAYKGGWGHLLPLVLDEFLKDEISLSCVKDGFERIVQMSPSGEFTEERKLFHAVQEALARQESTGRRLPIAA